MSWNPRSGLALVTASMACWLERQAAAQIEYLKADSRALRTRLGRRRILIIDAERQTLASLAKQVDRRSLIDLDPIVSPATPCCGGIGKWWLRNGRFSSGANPTDRVPSSTSSSSSSADKRKSGLGLYANPRRLDGLRYQGRARHDPADSQGSSDRTGAGPRAAHVLVDVSQSALARSRGQRLLYRRSLELEGSAYGPRSFRDRTGDAPGKHLRIDDQYERSLDVTNVAQPL
jgi:hypothetical protein